MKRLATLLVSLPLAAGGLVALTAPAAQAATCSTSGTSTSFTATCSGGGQFRAWVQCRRTSSSTYTYIDYGPTRNSGGTSKAVCGQLSGDYRVDQGVQFL